MGAKKTTYICHRTLEKITHGCRLCVMDAVCALSVPLSFFCLKMHAIAEFILSIGLYRFCLGSHSSRVHFKAGSS